MNLQTNLRDNVHAVVIGIDSYKDQKISNLRKARKDAESIYQIFTDPNIGRIPQERVALLVDEQATEKAIQSTIGTALKKTTGEDDLVLIFFAGHGAAEPDDASDSSDGYEKYLVPHDGESDDLFASAIRMEEIAIWFKRLKARQVVLLIDSCFSGKAGGRSFQNPDVIARASFTDEALEQIAENSEGRIILAACGPNELALELNDMDNGLFTHYILAGLRGEADWNEDGRISLNELFEYVQKNVQTVSQAAGSMMTPTLKGQLSGSIYLSDFRDGEIEEELDDADIREQLEAVSDALEKGDLSTSKEILEDLLNAEAIDQAKPISSSLS